MTCRPTWKPASPSAATLTSRLLPLSCPRQDNKLLDIFRCKDKNLSNKIKNLLGLLSDGGLSIHELAKLCVQLELGQVRQEVNRRLANKEEELNNIGRTTPASWSTCRPSWERNKVESFRIKGELEGIINKLEIASDCVN